MAAPPSFPNAETGGGTRRRLCIYNGGFLTNRRVRRILSLAGYDLRLGLPGSEDMVGVWGHSPTAWRGERIAARRGAPLLRVEDAFLRSVLPGRTGAPPIGLIADRRGVYFDASAPSDLEHHLAMAPLDDPVLLSRAANGIARMRAAHLSKYSATDPALRPPEPGYVLVVDQTRGDAAIAHGGAGPGSFAAMLAAARREHPGRRVVIKTHPETARGLRPGHFGPADLDARSTILTDPVSPWRLFDGAAAVYTVSSLLGFEAILAGRRPVVFGQPFYAGWGLSEDRNPPARRERALSAEQLFAAAMLDLPLWYDPCRDKLCDFETALEQIEAEARAWREDRKGHVAVGMRLWKRAHLQGFFGGAGRRLRFRESGEAAVALAAGSGRDVMVWAGREPEGLAADCAGCGLTLRRVEDGFLRSRGLGAELTPALSLVTDDLGIYYDPSRPSRLEALIAAAPDLPQAALDRAARLVVLLRRSGVSKYNSGAETRPAVPPGRPVILVPGQVEDDASILCGAGKIATNAGLLAAVREARPEAVILYKPHPDVEAGLRAGALTGAEIRAHADAICRDTDPAVLIGLADEVWTMTSLLGFEALIRGVRVTCLGVPFYAGWGLTDDFGQVPVRRGAEVTLEGLVHAALIAYPRYRDPVSGLPCTVEVAVERLASGAGQRGGPALRGLAKLQGWLAGHAHLWRGG